MQVSNYRLKLQRDLEPKQQFEYFNIMKPIVEAKKAKPDPNIEAEKVEQDRRKKL